MSSNRNDGRIATDALVALRLLVKSAWRRNLMTWIYVPSGILVILLSCFGIDSLLKLSPVTFPASVACLLILFFGLILSEGILGDRRTKSFVNVIDIPAGFALRWINIFFTPSFVLLPLSPPISGLEVGKIIAVFLLGFVAMLAVTAYMCRGLQLVLGSSKRTMTERAEEMGVEPDNIPLAEVSHTPSVVELPNVEDASDGLVVPERSQDPRLVRGTGGPPERDTIPQDIITGNAMQQAPLPLTRPQRWAAFLNLHFDRITYGLLFFIGLIVYYATGYAMPVQLTFSILAYFSALSLPAKWRQFLHPVLVSSAITIGGIWILGLVKADSLDEVLLKYKTGTNYLNLWHRDKNLKAPGAGDIFGSVLDASIVALALPMFQYRHELQRHFFAIVIPNVTISIGSLFGYPALCYAIGISSQRSLAFAARSLTLALATPAIENLHGDVNTVAALAIMSGILGVLIGPRLLEWLKIPEDDYVTRGVTLGGNSSAIATALLLATDPRAAALSSLSMSLFGIITLALTSVPPIVSAIDSLVEL